MDKNIAFDKAPESGLLLAYFRDGVVFEEYQIVNGKIQSIAFNQHEPESLLELHMFNQSTEFRAIFSRKRGFVPNDIVMVQENDDDFIDEVVLLNTKNSSTNIPSKLLVRSFISYDEYGMAKIENFKLLMEGEENGHA